MHDFERRYNSLILNKVTKVEDFVKEVALEQARLLERFIWLGKDQSLDGERLFPKNMEGGRGEFQLEN